MNKCRCGKGLQNMDQPKNMKEKNLRRANPLTLDKSTVNSGALESPKFID